MHGSGSMPAMGPMDQFLVPRRQSPEPVWRGIQPESFIRSSIEPFAVLSSELGWREPLDARAWRSACSRTSLARLRLALPPDDAREAPFFNRSTSMRRMCVSPAGIVAMLFSCSGVLVVPEQQVLQAADAWRRSRLVHAAACSDADTSNQRSRISSSSSNSSALESSNGGQSPGARLQPCEGRELPAAMPVPHVDRLESEPSSVTREMSCSPRSDVPLIAVIEAGKVKLHQLRPDGCNLSPSACSQLTLHSGLRVHDADAMTFLDAAAPHTLVANRRSSGCCVLWDLRASHKVVAEFIDVPTCTSPSSDLLQPLPGGQLLLAHAGEGQLSLFDLRRASSPGKRSRVVSLGGGASMPALVTSYSLPALSRSHKTPEMMNTMTTDDRCNQMYCKAACLAPHPSDPTLLAYMQENMQVFTFDLARGRVLDCLRVVAENPGVMPAGHHQRSFDLAASPVLGPNSLCWDASGCVLYASGLVHERPAQEGEAGTVTPTVVALDVGRRGAWRRALSGGGGGGGSGGNAAAGTECSVVPSCWSEAGTHTCHGGRARHVMMPPCPIRVAPSALALARDGSLLAGCVGAHMLHLA